MKLTATAITAMDHIAAGNQFAASSAMQRRLCRLGLVDFGRNGYFLTVVGFHVLNAARAGVTA